MMKYQSEMLRTWKRLREGQREREAAIHSVKVSSTKEEAHKAVKDRLKVLDKVGSTKEVVDLFAWKDFEIDGFNGKFVISWMLVVVLCLMIMAGM